ncbi:MAG TPA: transglycosylase SLT domain-containing protein [Longimicrobiaceae bacterium]|nr:transglycosylase SLT domain-containing protein [Longimicrobiaceae bacterium]
MRLQAVLRTALFAPVGLFAMGAGGFVEGSAQVAFASDPNLTAGDPAEAIRSVMLERLDEDLAVVRAFRPGYAFWEHVFRIPDGSVAYGNAMDGRLLAVFPARGDWNGSAHWEEPVLASLVSPNGLPSQMTLRRDAMAERLEEHVGPVIHNATRGLFVRPSANRYGSFLAEWGAIYERFGVPAELGLAQALIESGFNPKIRSEARAVGFCQWLESNWNHIKRLAPNEIESHNQTTQAAYCAAYLAILSAKYGSFIPALSEHHAGGTNVGRVLIHGQWLGETDVRRQYLAGAEFARDLREISSDRYRDVVRTYGPRSFRYSEMVFGNMEHVRAIQAGAAQQPIFAMRAPRSIRIEEVTRVTGLSTDEVRRYNPALVRQVPRGANLYLPVRVEAFGEDVTFWHQAPEPSFAFLMEEFHRMGLDPEQWADPAFEPLLQEYRARFRQTGTEEGQIMATMIAFAIDESFRGRRGHILREFRADTRVRLLFEQGVLERNARPTPLRAGQQQ